MGISFIATSLFALYILSLPLVAVFLASTQQSYPALNSTQLQQSNAQAIIVLGGGTRPPAPEYDNKIVIHQRVFDRLRYTVRLAKKTKLPVLISAGKVFDHIKLAEAEIIRETLIKDFQFKVDWLEDKSRNTAENAHYSYVFLNKKKFTESFWLHKQCIWLELLNSFEIVDFKLLQLQQHLFLIQAKLPFLASFHQLQPSK